MKIVDERASNRVFLSTIKEGETFKHMGNYYICPCAYVRGCGSIAGVNLATGAYVSDTGSTVVRRVEMEARVL